MTTRTTITPASIAHQLRLPSTGSRRWHAKDGRRDHRRTLLDGYSEALRELRETTVPQIARAVSAARPDAVLLTGG